MFALALEALRDWRELRMRRITIGSVAAMAFVGAISLARPLLLAFTATALFLLFGWLEGTRFLSDKSLRRTPSAALAPSSVVAGRALTALSTWAFIVLVVSPSLALSAIAWGLTAASLAGCALSWLIAYFASFGAGLLSTVASSRSEGRWGLLLIVLWLGSAFFSPALAASNPFVQDWDFLNETGGVSLFVGMAAVAFAAVLLFAAALWPLSRTTRKKP